MNKRIWVLVVLIFGALSACFIVNFFPLRSQSLSAATIGRIQSQLQGNDIDAQLNALHFISEHPPSHLLRHDIEHLAMSADPRVRAYVIRAISRYRDKEALALVEVLENDPDSMVSETARHYLHNLCHNRRMQN